MALAVWIYRLTDKLPDHERSGLSAALRRSATAVAHQVADADGRADVGAAIKHYEQALGALRELGTSALLCRRLRYLGAWDVIALRRRVARVQGWIENDLERCEWERDEQAASTPNAPQIVTQPAAFSPRFTGSRKASKARKRAA